MPRPSSWGGLPPAQIFQQGTDLAPLTAALNANDPEDLTIKTPVHIEQGLGDGTVFPQFTQQLDDEYVHLLRHLVEPSAWSGVAGITERDAVELKDVREAAQVRKVLDFERAQTQPAGDLQRPVTDCFCVTNVAAVVRRLVNVVHAANAHERF